METETLLDKVERSTDEEKELIAQIIGTSRSFQKSLSEALAKVQQDRNLTVRQAFATFKKKRVLKLFSRWIFDIISPYCRITPILKQKIKSEPLESIREILSSPEIVQELKLADPLAVYYLKGIQAKWDLLFGEDLPLDSGEVAVLLHITPQTVNRRRQKGRLLGIKLGQQGYLYPSWQFQQNRVIEGLESVLKEFQEADSWTKLLFLKTGDIRLNGATPLEKLRSGDIDAVVWAASCYGKQISA